MLDRDEVSHVIKGTLWSFLRMVTFGGWFIGLLLLIANIASFWTGAYTEYGVPTFLLIVNGMCLVAAVTGSVIMSKVHARTGGTATWQF